MILQALRVVAWFCVAGAVAALIAGDFRTAADVGLAGVVGLHIGYHDRAEVRR